MALQKENIKNHIFIAYHEGDIEMVKYLISQGAYIESKDGEGMTPLHISFYESEIDIFEY